MDKNCDLLILNYNFRIFRSMPELGPRSFKINKESHIIPPDSPFVDDTDIRFLALKPGQDVSITLKIGNVSWAEFSTQNGTIAFPLPQNVEEIFSMMTPTHNQINKAAGRLYGIKGLPAEVVDHIYEMMNERSK